MNTIKLSILTLAFCITGMAHADYSCISHDGKISLKMNEDYTTRGVGHTRVTVESEEDASTYYGITEISGGHLMIKKVVDFFNHSGSLTIVKKPKLCRRGSCDYNSDPIITGKLELDNSEIYFSCHQ